MANFIYGKAKQSLLNGEFNISSDSLKVLLVTESYVPNQNIDQFVSNISGSYIKQRTSSLTNVTNTLGVIDADNVLVSNYDGSAFKALVIYKDSGTDATSRLLAYIDTATGLPVSSSASPISITINWSNEQYKIFSL